MKAKLSLTFLCVLGIAGCDGVANVPSSAVEGSGIVATSRAKNTVTILYQKSSTTTPMLLAEANRICAKVGKSAGSSQEVALSKAGRIPGVDGKVIYQCM